LPEIFVRLRKPEAPEEYNLFEIDGIKVYLYKDAEPKKDTILIDKAKYSSDLAYKEFDVLGLKIK